jgi:hypothetical protein
MQVPKDRLLRLDGRPLNVGVLNAEHERSAGSASQQPVEERRARVTDMKLSRWAWSKANAQFLIPSS